MDKRKAETPVPSDDYVGIPTVASEHPLPPHIIILFESRILGAYSVMETPVPIPNTEVKHHHGDDTWVIKPWESSSVPGILYLSNVRGKRF